MEEEKKHLKFYNLTKDQFSLDQLNAEAINELQ